MRPSASAIVSILAGIGATGIISGWAASSAATPQDVGKGNAPYRVSTWPLPDNNTGDVSMDYLAYDPSTNTVWVPGGNTAAVDVVDAATGMVRQISGLATSQVEFRGGTRVLGPTAVSIGNGVVYIGNRGDSSVCAFHARSLAPMDTRVDPSDRMLRLPSFHPDPSCTSLH